MQAAITIDRSGSVGRGRQWARLVLALAAATGLGFGLGYIADATGHVSQPLVRVITVPAGVDTGCGEVRCPSYGALP